MVTKKEQTTPVVDAFVLCYEKNVIEYDAVEVNRLKTWINSQKAQDKKLKLSSKRKKMLEDIGVDFTYKW